MSDPKPVSAGARWGDLKARVLSGLAMVAVGALTIWLGGKAFGALAVLVCALMIWELATMTEPEGTPRGQAGGLAALAAALIVFVLFQPGAMTRWMLLIPVVVGTLMPRRDRWVFAAYAFAVMAASYGLIQLRNTSGAMVILWIVTIVVISDVAGYFAGRMIGGPKFWPKVSPKKTWSGTVAGWIGAVLVGALFASLGWGGWALVWLSPLLAFAGQMGDIAESAIKRRTGVKDSSNLIPGHGGVLDRFDALIGGVLFLLVVMQFMRLPFGGM
ncbi:MAG: phosphatidate cytidylyltransferase [Paenirhodobacter sp.]|uniref:phosphatidate cytidylyltransferase n=1 Tax=Paenirhodobacter sp. TaxID=1965326 RepID=UPI003D133DD9